MCIRSPGPNLLNWLVWARTWDQNKAQPTAQQNRPVFVVVLLILPLHSCFSPSPPPSRNPRQPVPHQPLDRESASLGARDQGSRLQSYESHVGILPLFSIYAFRFVAYQLYDPCSCQEYVQLSFLFLYIRDEEQRNSCGCYSIATSGFLPPECLPNPDWVRSSRSRTAV